MQRTRSTLGTRLRLFLLLALALATIPCAATADMVIDNGLSCAVNTANGTSPYDDDLTVENDTCTELSGQFHHVNVQDTSAVEHRRDYASEIHLYDSSSLELDGGRMHYVEARGSSHAEIKSGTMSGPMRGYDSATISIRGGNILGGPTSYDSSLIEVHGEGFRVDGNPVPFGLVEGWGRTLMGYLASGTWISGPSNSTNSGRILLVPATADIIEWNDDAPHLIAGDSWATSNIRASGTTHVEIQDNGSVAYLYLIDTATALVDGGTITGSLVAQGDATAELRRGRFENDIDVTDTARLHVRDGAVWRGLSAWQSSSLVISGGRMSNGARGFGTAKLYVSGGHVGGIYLYDSASAEVRGGELAGALFNYGTGDLTVMGSNFHVDGQPVPYGPVAQRDGDITGTLASGEPLNQFFSGPITLPEPDAPAIAIALVIGLRRAAATRRCRLRKSE